MCHVTLQRARPVAPSPQLGASSPPDRKLRPSGRTASSGELAPTDSDNKGANEMGQEGDAAAPPACGVGITFGRDKSGYFLVKALAAGGPAELSGLVLVGDTLVTVDGRPVKGIPYNELTPLILGSENSQVQFGLRRPSQPHTLVIAELRRGRVGPVGRPAERKSRQSSSARAQRVQEVMSLQTVEEDPSASTDAASRVRGMGNVSNLHAGIRETGAPTADAPATRDYAASSSSSYGPAEGKCGVGLTFRKDSRGYFTVLAINAEVLASEGGPKAVSVGDTLMHAGGNDVKDLDHAGLAMLILGPPHSVVALGLARPDGSTYVTRAVRTKPVGDAAPSSAPGAGAVAAAPAARAPSPATLISKGKASSGICDVGLRLSVREDGHIVVDEVLRGGPAEASNLIQIGDVLLQVQIIKEISL